MFYDFTILANNNEHDLYNYNDGYYRYINKYYGITRNPKSQDFIIIMKYYESGDLTHYIASNFFNIGWLNKLNMLDYIILGLRNIHSANIIHRDFHSGNIFLGRNILLTGDLGISKSAIESLNDDNEIYG